MNKMFLFTIKTMSVCLLIYFLVGITTGIYKNKKDIKDLKIKIQENKKINQELADKEKQMLERIDNLKEPNEIEKIAREVLNMKKPEEEIYRVIDEKK
ncbi:MAG: cell division protein FtsL [Fusobacteriaceae bacterium]|nr:cell division protein FtsL [Fusobacteriaceae bacterium]MBN2838633.1 cell division protein FtsL [Fusobacteriaceae bacterium]